MIASIYNSFSTAIVFSRRAILPALLLTVDFVAALAISLGLLWLVVVMPVSALAQEAPKAAVASQAGARAGDHAGQTTDIDRDSRQQPRDNREPPSC